MTKTVSIGLGGRNFIIDEDAYISLKCYLDTYEATLSDNKKEVMDEIEMRMADLLRASMNGREVVGIETVDSIAKAMGLPEGSGDAANSGYQTEPIHKFYRDSDDKKVGGVCSGIALFWDFDVTVVRIIALILLICGGAGFWVYVICWIIAPLAKTACEKCELRGIPCTVENMRKFTSR